MYFCMHMCVYVALWFLHSLCVLSVCVCGEGGGGGGSVCVAGFCVFVYVFEQPID